MAGRRSDETTDHVDLLEKMAQHEPPWLRVLTLVHHAAPDEQPAWSWSIDPSKVLVIGRDPGEGGAELIDPGASRRHAEIRFDDKQDALLIRDLGSRNGMQINGTRVEQAILESGTVIRIAESILVYSEALLPEGLPRPRCEPGVAPARAVAEAQADLAARSPMSILILGPTGAGKEVMAKRIHEASRRPGPMIAVNCASLSKELLASELFGHTAGAFSGASSARSGLFAAAEGGTLFLDEIAELPLDQQPALLRAVQEKTVRPVGSDKERKVDVRVIAATHRSLASMVAEGTFRRDLHARLSGFVVRLPGLAERREEIVPLFRELAHLGREGLSTDAAEALLLADWSSNIRELQQVAAQVELFAAGKGRVEITTLPAEFAERVAGLRKLREVREEARTYSREELVELLRHHQGNVANLAKQIGKHRAQVYRWLRKEGLNADDYRDGSPSHDA